MGTRLGQCGSVLDGPPCGAVRKAAEPACLPRAPALPGCAHFLLGSYNGFSGGFSQTGAEKGRVGSWRYWCHLWLLVGDDGEGQEMEVGFPGLLANVPLLHGPAAGDQPSLHSRRHFCVLGFDVSGELA